MTEDRPFADQILYADEDSPPDPAAVAALLPDLQNVIPALRLHPHGDYGRRFVLFFLLHFFENMTFRIIGRDVVALEAIRLAVQVLGKRIVVLSRRDDGRFECDFGLGFFFNDVLFLC